MSVVFVSGCILDGSGEGANQTTVKTLTKNGVMMDYPSDWIVSQASSNKSLVAISKSDSIDRSKVGQVTVNVEKTELSQPLKSYINQTYSAMEKDDTFELVSSGNITVNGEPGFQYIYTAEAHGSFKQHKAVWIEHGNEAYVILCSAPVQEFDSNLKTFDFIISNFKITA